VDVVHVGPTEIEAADGPHQELDAEEEAEVAVGAAGEVVEGHVSVDLWPEYRNKCGSRGKFNQSDRIEKRMKRTERIGTDFYSAFGEMGMVTNGMNFLQIGALTTFLFRYHHHLKS
jgi:hypothetical protein